MAPFFIGLVLVWDNLWASLRRLSETKKSPSILHVWFIRGSCFLAALGRKG